MLRFLYHCFSGGVNPILVRMHYRLYGDVCCHRVCRGDADRVLGRCP